MSLLQRIWFKLCRLWWQLAVPFVLRARGVELGSGVVFYGWPVISLAKGSRIVIGNRVVLCSDSRFTALGVNHPVVMRTLRSGAEIVIGDDCGISGGSLCAAMRITLGAECLLGANVVVADTDFHPLAPSGRRYNTDESNIAAKPVAVAGNVFLGTGTVVLKGVTIGANSVVGASSLVVDDVPPNVIAAGQPARVVRSL